MRLVVVSGLSGAGKSVAMDALEDLGYYCIDNLPVSLLRAFAGDVLNPPHPAYERAAVAIDARNPEDALNTLPDVVEELRAKGLLKNLVFIEAGDPSLIRRYSETRRKHPLTAENVSLQEAIGRERSLLAPLRDRADIVIDTSSMHLHQLRDMVRRRVDQRPAGTLSLLFQSFGYKHGVPQDTDMVFDVRCLPNPHWEARLRPLTGRDPEVASFLESDPAVEKMFDSVKTFLEAWIPKFEGENRAYLTVSIGCTGGQHRSVYLVERLAAYFKGLRDGVMLRHRQLGLGEP